MYRIYADNQLLYDPSLVHEGYGVLSAVLTTELNKAGSLQLLLAPDNVMYDSLSKLKTTIRVFDDGIEIWRGRVLHEEKNFYNCKTVYCEGALSFLNDTIMRPYEFEGEIGKFLEKLLNDHGGQASSGRKITYAGTDMTNADGSTTIKVSSTEYTSTLNELIGKTVNSMGGYLKLTKGGGGSINLGYYKEYGKVSDQVIEFGVNLLDITEYIDAENVFTVLIPLGKKTETSSTESAAVYSMMRSVSVDPELVPDEEGAGGSDDEDEEDDYDWDSWGSYEDLISGGSDYGDLVPDVETVTPELGDVLPEVGTDDDIDTELGADVSTTTKLPLTIKSVNDGKDYLENEDAIKLFGRIVRVQTWNDIEDPSILKTKGQEFLDANIEMAVTLSVKAVDMTMVGVDVDKISLGDYIRVISAPHGLDKNFLCSKIKNDLLKPDACEYTLGVGFSAMTDKQVASSKLTNDAYSIAESASTGVSDVNVNVAGNYLSKSDFTSYQSQVNSNFDAINSKLTSVFHYKGTVSTFDNLPSANNVIGDTYNVTDSGANYAWSGSDWDKLSENITLSRLLPEVTSSDNGKSLMVKAGAWQAGKHEKLTITTPDGTSVEYDGTSSKTVEIPASESGLPEVTEEDNGKSLVVKDGVWQTSPQAKLTITNTEGTTFEYDGTCDVAVKMESPGSTGWTLINEVTLDADVDVVEITTDANGEAFSYNNVLAVLYVKATASGCPLVYIPNKIWASGTYCNASNKIPSDYFASYIFEMNANEKMFAGWEHLGTSGFSDSPSGLANTNRHSITSFKFNAQGTTFVTGSVFKLFGRS